MNPEDLAGVKRRAAAVSDPVPGHDMVATWRDSANDVPALLAEIERLTPDTVTTTSALRALPVGTVIRDSQTLVLERYAQGWRNGWSEPMTAPVDIYLPAVVLFVPEERHDCPTPNSLGREVGILWICHGCGSRWILERTFRDHRPTIGAHWERLS